MIGIHVYGEISFPVTSLIEIIIILAAAVLSFATTKREIRLSNHFTWGAIKEVAVLFIGIFITMEPALMILEQAGSSLGLNHPLSFSGRQAPCPVSWITRLRIWCS